jgi:hypothetical protein
MVSAIFPASTCCSLHENIGAELGYRPGSKDVQKELDLRQRTREADRKMLFNVAR